MLTLMRQLRITKMIEIQLSRNWHSYYNVIKKKNVISNEATSFENRNYYAIMVIILDFSLGKAGQNLKSQKLFIIGIFLLHKKFIFIIFVYSLRSIHIFLYKTFFLFFKFFREIFKFKNGNIDVDLNLLRNNFQK